MKILQKILITTGGLLFVLFGIFHLFFWKMFDWKNELSKLSITNSNIMQMLNIGCSFIVLSLAYILLFHRKDIINEKLGKPVLIMSGLFYFIRMVMEFAFPEGSLVFAILMFFISLIYIVPALIK